MLSHRTLWGEKPWTGDRKWMAMDAAYKKRFSHSWIWILNISDLRSERLFGLLPPGRTVRRFVWLVLLEWNDRGLSHQSMKWTFFSLAKKQKDGCNFSFLTVLLFIFMHLLLTASQLWRKMVAAIIRVTLGCFPLRGFWGSLASLPRPPSLEMLEQRRPSYLIRTSVPSLLRADSLAFSVKHVHHFSAISLQVFSAECVCGELGLSVVRVAVQAVYIICWCMSDFISWQNRVLFSWEILVLEKLY